MLRPHRIHGIFGLKIKAVRCQGFGSPTELAFLRQQRRSSDIGGGGRFRGGGVPPAAWRRLGCLSPEFVQASVSEGGNPLLNGSSLLFKFPFGRRKEKEELVADEGLQPFVGVGGVADDVQPDGVFRLSKGRPR